jgi:glyoxylase-like metal-dependent hydrolase (beta-lactamase superfamily II)
MKTRLAILAVAAAAALPTFAQQVPTVRALTEPWPDIVKVDGIEILHVQKNVYMLVGGGANVTAQIGDEGVLLVDTGSPNQGEKIVAAAQHLTKRPFRYIIDTCADVDHAGGNTGAMKEGGGRLGANGIAGRTANEGILEISTENAMNRLLKGSPNFPPATGEAVPESTFFTPRKSLYSNGEAVQILFQPGAHTDGDAIVFFRGSDVISAGEVFRTDSYPIINVAEGGTIAGELAALNNILDITVPERNEMGGTRVIPAYGRIGNQSDVLEYRDMLTIIRDRIRDMVKKNMTLAQVKAAKPTLEYDGLYGQKVVTGDQFIEVIYNELSKKK